MVQIRGNATTGNSYPETPISLPRPAAGVRRAHRPWCRDCKVTLDAAQLDDDGRCVTCAQLAVRRAEAAERRRLADITDAASETAPAPTLPPTAQPAAARKKGPPSRISDAGKAELARRYRAGEGGEQLAKAYGVSAATVYKYIRATGTTIRPRRSPAAL